MKYSVNKAITKGPKKEKRRSRGKKIPLSSWFKIYVIKYLFDQWVNKVNELAKDCNFTNTIYSFPGSKSALLVNFPDDMHTKNEN